MKVTYSSLCITVLESLCLKKQEQRQPESKFPSPFLRLLFFVFNDSAGLQILVMEKDLHVTFSPSVKQLQYRYYLSSALIMPPV